MFNIEILIQYLPLLLPLGLLQLGLMIAALVHLFKHRNVRVGSVVLWAILIILFNLLGPVLYFLLGRGERDSNY